ncbi:MAG TPA: hypothetical protein VLE53_17665 [Gemmatimonadaceae bacterium]|nr:hypothetical protein [Gemmatimonadaceae bacterium]
MTALPAIRLAMLGGVLLFGAVCWALQRSPDWAPASNVDPESLRLVARLLWAGAIAGVFILMMRARGVTSAARASTLGILSWALGEMVALFGAVVYFLTGVATWYIGGVVFLALTFLLLPGRLPR